MKKKMRFAILSIAVFVFAIHSASALTEYKYDDWYAGEGYGTKTKVDENITNLKGEYSEESGEYQAPFSKAAKDVKLADGITEEVYVGVDFDTIANGEFYDVSLALKKTDANGGEQYVSEAVIASQRVGDKVQVTAGWAPDFKAYISKKGVYTYQWKMWIEGTGNAKKTYVQFTLLQGENEIATTGKVDFDTLTTADTLNPIADQGDVTVKYLWFCSLNIARGLNVYTELPTVKLTLVSPLADEEDEVLEVYKYTSLTPEEAEELEAELKKIAKEEGYNFEGFYTDKEFTIKFDFTKSFEENVSIYTKLTKIEEDKPADDSKGNTTPTETKPEKNPGTSDINLALIISAIVVSAVGVVITSKKISAKVTR